MRLRLLQRHLFSSRLQRSRPSIRLHRHKRRHSQRRNRIHLPPRRLGITILAAFRSALTDSNAEPDVVCLLAEVLWARGGSEERNVAKEQLFEAIQQVPGHVNATVLLGAMSVVEEDEETLDAVREELEALRVQEGLTQHDVDRIERVLEAITQISPQGSGGTEVETLNEIQQTTMLYPWKATGWRRLAAESGDAYAQSMALEVASMLQTMLPSDIV